MLKTLTKEDFEPHVCEVFTIQAEGLEPFEAELIEVSAMRSGPIEGRQPFSIVLRTGQQDSYLVQAIYRVGHKALGSLDLFLVPLGPDGQGMRYEAVFT
jgi:hypothetical protein